MGFLSAKLFSWLQGAEFYISMHKEAIEGIPEGEGRSWVDAGCGPGLLARLAAKKGYVTLGIDRNASMIREAIRVAGCGQAGVRFLTGDLSSLAPESADVVSASSLLAVLEDRIGGLTQLMQIVKPGGVLVIIEPTSRMNPKNAGKLLRRGLIRHRKSALRLWALARQGNTVDPLLFEAVNKATVTFTPLLDGLAGAWFIRKEA
jgi:ubiquinone/menaquinone biosynthesis C-methylase UbiE